jgi:uncharacterized protein DUF488
MSDASPPRIWTVGHGARPVEDLMGDLERAGVRRLVDVRTAPGSRRHLQFGRDVLEAALRPHGIAYEWRKDLGGFRRPRPDSPHHAIRNDAFRGYADHMDTQEFRSALAWLEETSAGVPTAVMCAESVWWRCHRRMIARRAPCGRMGRRPPAARRARSAAPAPSRCAGRGRSDRLRRRATGARRGRVNLAAEREPRW